MSGGNAASAWDPRNGIYLDGHPFAVTAKLLSALQQPHPMARSSQPMVFCFDAVCISQSDLDERNQEALWRI
ncbi:hypothetical protein C8A03DRAFT_18593 [Achaetomium macrosporum]|uniref:Heterokaryon incompatibility domain-containing protein n=1 Tax=Achaetomium macrosporum TaxID=79813 RepID=A0AAN7HB54_9PEZI|nr:hypothetical protein C8A03DRAFT_18593 [Achaetomium macrosporum]